MSGRVDDREKDPVPGTVLRWDIVVSIVPARDRPGEVLRNWLFIMKKGRCPASLHSCLHALLCPLKIAIIHLHGNPQGARASRAALCLRETVSEPLEMGGQGGWGEKFCMVAIVAETARVVFEGKFLARPA